MPFYGRGWQGVESSDPWNTGTGSLQVGGYRVIAETFLKSPDYVRYWDDVAKVPWLYNAARKEWITYEDPQSMQPGAGSFTSLPRPRCRLRPE